ncbi:hypothetical protein RI129_002172 [Pyrocoelia pectoralis]|uniref:Carboxylesterase type B domain-containing protein n=1 Tax=Pyrocoelia pectoralis TaxID=417401 RepID=A0AAN7VFF7_9COLE
MTFTTHSVMHSHILLSFIVSIVLIKLINCNDPVHSRVRRIVGGSPADVPPLDDPVVYLRFGGRSARVHGVREFPHYVFKGIRYAHPPTGKERFLRPRQFFLSGDIDATTYPPPCIQPVQGQDNVIGEEDCLFLNIFTPDLPLGTEGLPVIVWIHGGGFRYGSASQYGVKHLVGKRLVIVAIQYRLGTLGFLGTGTRELPGNAALWDMVLAVQWVRNHIGFFGGNPYQIVVMGQGTGASSAVLVALNDVAKGYTNGVVALSGTALSNWAVDSKPGETAKEMADLQGCPTTNPLPMIKCLQAISANKIVKSDSVIEASRLKQQGFVSGIQGQLSSSPVTEYRFDGRSLPPMVDGEPLDKLVEKKVPKIPLLTGITKDETKRAIHGKFGEEIKEKLQSVQHYLDEVLVQKLQSFTSFGKKAVNQTLHNNLLNVLDPFKFRNYVKVARNNLQEGISRIAEMTVDALFNLPAFLTADLWSKTGAPAYLYRFEHATRKKRAHHFLHGLPIVDSANDDVNDTVSHGDDLIYLFEANSLNGTPIANAEEDFTDDDRKMRNIFTDMIYKFAKRGKIDLNNKEVPTFSSDQNNYVQISTKPSLVNNFRFCQMGLWAGLTERLQSTMCNALNVLESQIKNTEFLLFDTIHSVGEKVHGTQDKVESNVNKVKDFVGHVVPDPFNLFGAKSKNTSTNNQESTPRRGFFGL